MAQPRLITSQPVDAQVAALKLPPHSIEAEQSLPADRDVNPASHIAARREPALVGSRPVTLVVEGACADSHVGVGRRAPA